MKLPRADYRFFDPTNLSADELHPPQNESLVNHVIYEGDGASDELVIGVPAWHNGSPQYERFAERVSKSGKTVCAFYFADDILSADMQRTLDNHHEASRQMIKTVEALKAERGAKKVHVVIASLGTVAGVLAIGNGLPVDKLTMVTFGDDLALSMCQGERTQHLEDDLADQGWPEKNLQEAWQELAPIRYAAALRGIPVTGYLSRADRVIPYNRGTSLLVGLDKAGAKVQAHVNSFFGHYATIGLYYLYGRVTWRDLAREVQSVRATNEV